MSKKLAKKIIHSVAGTRKFYYSNIKELAKTLEGKKILEIGSGKQVGGSYAYSIKHLFPESNNFVQSDINSDFGHEVIDITDMDFKNEFDCILCVSVLEHIYEFEKAIDNMQKALKPKGILVVGVPGNFPLHDEPHDYWRFTEHSLRRMFSKFKDVKIRHRGIREFPSGYYLEAKK